MRDNGGISNIMEEANINIKNRRGIRIFGRATFHRVNLKKKGGGKEAPPP